MTKADIMREHGFVMLMPPDELYRELTDEEAKDFINNTVMIMKAFRAAFDSEKDGTDDIY